MYVEYFQNLKNCEQLHKHFTEERKRVDDMKVVLMKHKSKDKDDTSSTFNTQYQVLVSRIDDITQLLQEVENMTQKCRGDCTEQKERNVEELDKIINVEKERIVSIIDRLNGEVLLTKTTTFKEALDDLGKIKKKCDESVKRLN